MNQYERAGFEAALEGKPRDAFAELGEVQVDEDWRRGWDRGSAVLERCIDVVREVMHAWSHCDRALAAVRASEPMLAVILSADERERLRATIDETQGDAWRRVRPALRELLASVREELAR